MKKIKHKSSDTNEKLQDKIDLSSSIDKQLQI